MNSVFRKVTQNGEEPYNAPPAEVGCYENYESYPFASSNSLVFISSYYCLDSGNYPAVQSYTSYSVMNQRGVGTNICIIWQVAPFHTDFVRNRNYGNGGSIE